MGNNTILKQKNKALFILGVAGGFLSLFAVTVFANFQSPSANPPEENIVSPLNTGEEDQVKEGALTVGSLGIDTALFFEPLLGHPGACETALEGTMYFNAEDNAFYGCNGAGWKNLGAENLLSRAQSTDNMDSESEGEANIATSVNVPQGAIWGTQSYTQIIGQTVNVPAGETADFAISWNGFIVSGCGSQEGPLGGPYVTVRILFDGEQKVSTRVYFPTRSSELGAVWSFGGSFAHVYGAEEGDHSIVVEAAGNCGRYWTQRLEAHRITPQ